MVQGLGKKKKSAEKDTKRKTGPTRGAKVIAPKKHQLVKKARVTKKLTASINKNIEKQMATKAGAVSKLTIMKHLAEAGGKATRGKEVHGKETRGKARSGKKKTKN
ncbi:hypothetical protein BC938DRAFT_470775 [Jimgerdemannia flammicorona]|uniref:Uncharacterized protein n=1 Tax=Jimgerdemannia flammicorona TaxID=994334 RepID=A0A433QV75_9FUNG|nr:hypothetical protein BC938DRAFT_470775 [Jimgerdemannia flammicorona]